MPCVARHARHGEEPQVAARLRLTSSRAGVFFARSSDSKRRRPECSTRRLADRNFERPAFTGCPGSGSSQHIVYWQPVPGANRYEVYWSPQGQFLFQYSSTVFGATQVPTFNSINAEVKVKACNGSGCSWLSVQSY